MMLTVAGMNGEWGGGGEGQGRGGGHGNIGRSQEEEERKERRKRGEKEGGSGRKEKPCVRRKYDTYTGYFLVQCQWQPLYGH